MKNRKLAFLVGICFTLILLVTGCGTSVDKNVTFAQLTANPGQHNNKTITITGYWFDGFETEVLAENLVPSTYAPGNLQPAGTKIWVKNGLPADISKNLYLQPDNSTGYQAHYGKVEITGVFEYGGQYGQMNSYQYQLTVQSAKIIAWSP
jgi:hypothetical protein